MESIPTLEPFPMASFNYQLSADWRIHSSERIMDDRNHSSDINSEEQIEAA